MDGRYVELVEGGLLPELQIESVDPHDPVVVRHLPAPWTFVGAGNYTAVFAHPDYPELVTKVYAPGRLGLREEAEVYRKLGVHPAYSRCFHVGGNYLVLLRLRGVTFYDCLRLGIRIPPQAVREIDAALAYARHRGLNPSDVHAKNVMLHEGRGLVADISDFGEPGSDTKWDDLRRVYFRFYLPTLGRWTVRIPEWLLNLVRRGYRRFRRYFSS